jgi:DNA-directed RNA polymerase beta subunit
MLKQYITWEGFGDHHIEVYDNWIFRSAYNNVYGRTLTFQDGRTICFENLKIFHPRYTRDGKVLPLTPKLAREQEVTYGGDWHVDVILRRGGYTGEELDRRSGVCIGTVPTMLKSSNCILHGKTPRELALFGEDPKDPGGYFIVSGVEKVVLLQELLASNKIFLMNMDSKGSTVARMTANTPRGTALIELALDKKTRSIIKMRFPAMRGTKQGEKYKSINVLRLSLFS